MFLSASPSTPKDPPLNATQCVLHGQRRRNAEGGQHGLGLDEALRWSALQPRPPRPSHVEPAPLAPSAGDLLHPCRKLGRRARRGRNDEVIDLRRQAELSTKSMPDLPRQPPQKRRWMAHCSKEGHSGAGDATNLRHRHQFWDVRLVRHMVTVIPNTWPVHVTTASRKRRARRCREVSDLAGSTSQPRYACRNRTTLRRNRPPQGLRTGRAPVPQGDDQRIAEVQEQAHGPCQQQETGKSCAPRRRTAPDVVCALPVPPGCR